MRLLALFGENTFANSTNQSLYLQTDVDVCRVSIGLKNLYSQQKEKNRLFKCCAHSPKHSYYHFSTTE
ncbi:unnamed protein product [Adineta ricciae]|uniref:Uncharacterized protein n=1 Tax=Adineta ricciae TaxID=249248 RepID=A0A813P7X3_ADIRI|nr:unnamed protein product [Adineta ricciae]